jgi:hypothetical protein
MSIVLTASCGGLAFQVAIRIYSMTYASVVDNLWNIAVNPPVPVWPDHEYPVSGIVGSYHTIRLQIYSDSGTWRVGWWVDSFRYYTYVVPASTFDRGMTPSVVIESFDDVTNDWTGRHITGILRTGTTSLHTEFYGGWWGHAHAGCTSSQTTNFYVGDDMMAPINVGTTGSYLGLAYTGYLNCIGDTTTCNTLSDAIIQDLHDTWASNPSRISVG